MLSSNSTEILQYMHETHREKKMLTLSGERALKHNVMWEKKNIPLNVHLAKCESNFFFFFCVCHTNNFCITFVFIYLPSPGEMRSISTPMFLFLKNDILTDAKKKN